MEVDCNCDENNSLLAENDIQGVCSFEKNHDKDKPIDMNKYCNFFLKQQLLRDEPCSHSDTKCISRQRRCADEMESVIITCLSCGRVQQK